MQNAADIRLSGRVPARPPGWLGRGRVAPAAWPVRYSCGARVRSGTPAGCGPGVLTTRARPDSGSRCGPGAGPGVLSAPTPTTGPVVLALPGRAGPAVDAVVERLDAERVPGAEQLAGPGVPDGERVHAAEAVHDLLAHPGVGLEQHLGVAAGPQRDPLIAQFLAKLDVVVDLPVVDHPVAAVGGAHRLVPGQGKVDDGQPAEPECHVRVGVHAFVVGPAMADTFQRARDPVLVRVRLKGQCQAASDSAHRDP